MFKKMTKVVFIIAMLIQLVPTNIFANEEQKNFISNYIELKTEGEATGVYAQDALDIPEASYKLNVTVNVDGETKEASTLAYDLSTNPEQVSVMALDGYTVASTKLDNIDYHQEIIAFDHENNITSKELVINVTSNPKSELPQEFQSPMINRSAFGIFDQTAYFYLLKPGKDFNSDRGNESYLYVGDGRVNNSGIRVTDAPSNREIKKTMDELAKNIENVVSVTFNGWNRIAKADGAVDKNGNIIASGRQYHVDGTFNVVTRKQVTVNFKVMNPENLDISQDLGINSYLTDKNNEIVMPMSDAAKNYEYNGEKYDFDGWYTDASYTNKVQSDKYQIGEESMTFYAKYVKADTKFNYTINFYKDDKLVEGDTISAYEIAWNHQEKLNVNIEQYKNKYVGYNFDRNDPIETNQIVKNGVIKIYYVKDATKWTTVTFNNGTKGSLRGQDANGNVIFKDILKGTTLAANNINAPKITPNENCQVAETPWNNGYAADKVIDQETTFTAQYKKNINFTVYLNDDFLSSDDHWVHLDKDMTGHTDNLVYTEDQIKGFANEYITKKKYAKDTYKLVFTTKIEYLDNNTKKWKNYDPELNKVLNEGFEVRYHVYIVKKLDVKFDLNNNEEDVNYKVYNGSKLSDKQSVPTPSKTGYTFIGWKMDDKAKIYTNTQIEALNFKDNTTFKAQYVKDEAQRKEMSYQVQYFKDGKLVDDQKVTKKVWINDTKVALDKIDVANDKFKGYVFKETNPKNLPDAVENNAIIKVYYVKDEAQRKEMSYQVQYFKDGKLVDKETQTVTKKVW
ncbi:MAG: InlB B-repeat-containing protein, partial [Erysipelotrichaceae bacterium]